MTGTWFCLGYFYGFNVLGYVFDSMPLILLCTFVWIPETILMVLFLDSISRETVDPWKICGAAVVSTFLLATAWSPDAIIPFSIGPGIAGWDWGGNFKIATYIIFLFVGLLYFYYCTKIYLHSTKKLKRDALILWLGSILVSIIPFVLVATNVYLQVLGIEAIVQGIGVWLCAREFASHPQLAFVLPFKVTSLTVMNSKSGLPLFSYRWDKSHKDFDEMLFSGMLQGIGGILNEAMNQGYVREVRMSRGLLLLHHVKKHNLAFVLATTKMSSILGNALDVFADNFVIEFSSCLDQINIADRFNGATELIRKFFSFIPEIE